MNVHEFKSSTPLVLALVGEPDRSGYQEEVKLAELITASYDAKSQTSTVPAYAGTSRTVCYKGTGTLLTRMLHKQNDLKRLA